ncbi:MAG: hypothetical protein KJ069_15855 [Anaerolineae bacterium]|nr:hypothetical protein [Anaerolineae bacterium]
MIGVRDNCTGSGLDFGGQELDKNDGDGARPLFPAQTRHALRRPCPLCPSVRFL